MCVCLAVCSWCQLCFSSSRCRAEERKGSRFAPERPAGEEDRHRDRWVMEQMKAFRDSPVLSTVLVPGRVRQSLLSSQRPAGASVGVDVTRLSHAQTRQMLLFLLYKFHRRWMSKTLRPHLWLTQSESYQDNLPWCTCATTAVVRRLPWIHCAGAKPSRWDQKPALFLLTTGPGSICNAKHLLQ